MKMAATGAFGTSPNNCERDLKREFLKGNPVPGLDFVRIPYNDPKDGQDNLVHGDAQVLSPTKLIHMMWQKHQEELRSHKF